ncbi:MAG: hypothetical protein ACRCXN_13075 [Bacteroidales bacterium]
MLKNFLSPLNAETRKLVFEAVANTGELMRKEGLSMSRIRQYYQNAINIDINPTDGYVAKFIQEFLHRLYSSATIIRDGHATLRSGVKFLEKNYKVDVGVKFGDVNDDFTSADTPIDIIPVEYSTVAYSWQNVVNTRSLLGSGFTETYGPGVSGEDTLPVKVLQAIMEDLARKVPYYNQLLFFRGKTHAPMYDFTPEYKGAEQIIFESSASKKLKVPNVPILGITNAEGFIAYQVDTSDFNKFEIGDALEARGIVDSGGNVGAKLNSQVYNVLPYSDERTTHIFIEEKTAPDLLVTNIPIAANGISIGSPDLTNAKAFYLNTENVANQLLAIYRITPDYLIENGFRLYMHGSTYRQFDISQGIRLGGDLAKQVEKVLKAIPIVQQNSSSPLVVFGSTPDNFVIDADDMSEESNLFVNDLRPKTGARKTQFELAMKTGVTFPKPEETIILSPA